MSSSSASLRVLLALALPMVLSRATQSVMTFADALMVEHLGPQAIAASATGGFNVFLVMILPMGTVFIVQSFVAQHVGANDRDATPRYAYYGLIIAAVSGILALALIPAMDPLLAYAKFSPAVREPMSEYMTLRLYAVAGVVAVEVLGNWYGGLGNTWMALAASVISMVVDLFLNWVLIYGNLGAPEMGVNGAALSSTIGSYVGLAFLLVAFWRRWGMAIGGAPAPARGRPRLSFRELFRVIRFGLPNGLNWFGDFAAFQIFINVVFASLGDDTLAALNVVIAINSLAFMPAFGLASAGAILAGQAIGAAYLIAPRPLLQLFNSSHSSPLFVEVGVTMLLISAAWQLFDAIGITLSETLRAAGDTTWTAMARLGPAWFVFVPGAYYIVMRRGGGPVGAMLCLVGYLALLAALFAYRFKSGAWRQIQLIEPKLVE